ncbi:MAG: hypothetical protein IT320_01880 [Anaerolineae bacterium]|nr:hypothetical protein [Anaerolineae bacterium]
MNINFDAILNLLSLSPSGAVVGSAAIWSIFQYLIFILAFLALILMPNKNLPSTLLIAFVLMAVIVAKLAVAGAAISPFFQARALGILFLNATTSLFPFLVAGMTRTRKRSNPVVPIGIFMGIIGGVYTFAYWYFVQQF